jgi:hypothetical protein
MSDLKHCQATPSWTISVPVDFAEIDNGDSWQAHADTRSVYVSSVKVAEAGSPVSSTALRATVARKLAPQSAAERHNLDESGVQGDAQILRTATGFELRGFACTDGVVATCVINFDHEDHREWAIGIWRSLRPVPRSVKANPWWRFW